METTKRAREEVRWEDMLFLLLISGAALLTRFYLFPIESNDYQQFLQNWFATLKENGGLAAHRDEHRRLYAAVLLYFSVADLSAVQRFIFNQAGLLCGGFCIGLLCDAGG